MNALFVILPALSYCNPRACCILSTHNTRSKENPRIILSIGMFSPSIPFNRIQRIVLSFVGRVDLVTRSNKLVL